MNRTLWILPLLAGLLAGCSHKAAPSCGDLATFDVTNCDLASLSALDQGGIWNFNTQWVTGASSPGVFSLLTPGSETVNGLPAQDKQFGPKTYYLASTFQQQGHTYRMALVGCGSQDSQHFGGQVAFCADGTLASSGLFKAAREVRGSGEGESSHLALLSETKLPVGVASDVYVANGYAYVSALTDGLIIFDVHDRTHPSMVAQLTPTNDFWHDAWVQGSVLYVASASEGVIVYDVSNPAQPQRLMATPADKPDVYALFVDSNRLYAASPDPNGEILIYDISTPANPVLLSRFQAVDNDPSTGAWPSGVFAAGNTLYVSHWTLGLVVADVTDPTHPKQLGVYSYSNATAHACVVGTFNGKNITFLGDDDWGSYVRVLDVTDATHIAQLTQVQLRPQNSIHNLVLVGNKLYAAYYQEGVRIFDISNSASPVQVGYFNTWRESDPIRGQSFYEGVSGIRVPGDGYVYAAETSRGLMIFQEN